VSVLDGFLATWSDAKATFGEGTPETGAKFDQEYLEDVVEDHKKDVKEFEKQSKAGKDPELTKWAAEKLPMVQEHLRLAEAAKAKGASAKKK